METIDELESENADLQNAQERVTNLEAEIFLLKQENKKLKAAQSANKNKSSDNSNGSKRKAVSLKASQKRIKTRER